VAQGGCFRRTAQISASASLVDVVRLFISRTDEKEVGSPVVVDEPDSTIVVVYTVASTVVRVAPWLEETRQAASATKRHSMGAVWRSSSATEEDSSGGGARLQRTSGAFQHIRRSVRLSSLCVRM
jgi:hypothetical protein